MALQLSRISKKFIPLSSDVGTLGALGAGAPVKIVVSRAYPYTMCSFFTPTSSVLSCSVIPQSYGAVAAATAIESKSVRGESARPFM